MNNSHVVGFLVASSACLFAADGDVAPILEFPPKGTREEILNEIIQRQFTVSDKVFQSAKGRPVALVLTVADSGTRQAFALYQSVPATGKFYLVLMSPMMLHSFDVSTGRREGIEDAGGNTILINSTKSVIVGDDDTVDDIDVRIPFP